MIELLALVGAIILVIAVQLLRALLAMPLARLRWRRIGAAAPPALAELYAEWIGQAQALGFGPPVWLQVQRCDGEPDSMPLRALLQHPSGSLLWLAPPVNANTPHRLTGYFEDRLTDGRSAISQPFDGYFALLQDDRLLARSASEPELAPQWQAHRDWVDGLGSARHPLGEAELVDHAEQFFEQLRQRLLARGQLRAISDDLALPRLPLALRMLLGYLRTPKPAADLRPVPAARLALLARVQEAVRHRTPPRDVQWALFGFSVALFVALGGVLWNLEVALAILLVVLIHELGHFSAMRAFGYRNVHMLALPLVGGVAIGHDVDPAATRRAWMSLMGPLPGILIGWALVALIFTSGFETAGFLLPLAIIFLLINYLNVLPIPPLDGAHVLEALLPLRWARLQTVILGSAAVLGAWLAWQWEFYLLTALALLQLPALPNQWRLHGAERQLAADPELRRLQRPARLLRVLQHLQQDLGATAQASARINQALHVLQRLDTRPMGGLARGLTAVVYLALLVVPVGVLVSDPFGTQQSGQAQQQVEQISQEWQQLQAQATTLSWSQLLQDLNTAFEPSTLPAPASAEALAAAEQRLGQALPADLRHFYQTADGLPALGIVAVARLERAGARADAAGYDGQILLEAGAEGWVELASAELSDAWYLGEDDYTPLFYLTTALAPLGSARVLDGNVESASSYADLRAYLEAHWSSTRQAERSAARVRAAESRVLARLADASVGELLAAWPRPALTTRLLLAEAAWPDAAAAEAITAVEHNLALNLPDELEAVWERHDGFPPLQLLAVGELQRWHQLRERLRDDQREHLFGDGEPIAGSDHGQPLRPWSEDRLRHCLLVAGRLGEPPAPLWPRLLWCPDGTARPWVDLGNRRSYASLREWMLPQAVQIQAAQAAWQEP